MRVIWRKQGSPSEEYFGIGISATRYAVTYHGAPELGSYIVSDSAGLIIRLTGYLDAETLGSA